MQVDYTPLTLPMTQEELDEFRVHVINSGVRLPSNIAGNQLDSLVLYRQKWNVAWENYARIKKFAEIHELSFLERVDNVYYPGIMAAKSKHGDRALYNCVRLQEAPRVEWGNFDWFGEPNSPKSHIQFGYVAIELSRHMPHMILDSRRNNVRSFGIEESHIKSQFSSEQRLELEGDFATHFTLYAPRQYKQDAYYLFTPDFMAELVDEAGDFDVEIIDNYLFLYSPAPFAQYTPELVDRILRITSIIGSKAHLRSSRYRDDRQVSTAVRHVLPSVAPEGRRLAPSTVMYRIAAILLWAFAAYIIGAAVVRAVNAIY